MAIQEVWQKIEALLVLSIHLCDGRTTLFDSSVQKRLLSIRVIAVTTHLVLVCQEVIGSRGAVVPHMSPNLETL